MCFNTFGANAMKKFKEFKKFFSLVDSREVTPPQRECLNYKVRFLFDWMNKVSYDSWVLGNFFNLHFHLEMV